MTVRELRLKAYRIVRARFATGESADSIARAYGVRRRVVYIWASGEGLPSRTIAGRIVAARGLSKRPDSSAPGGGA